MTKVVLVAFRGTIAAKVMERCGEHAGYAVGSSEQSIQRFVATGTLRPYDWIIAMGLKNRSRDASVHVETVCYSQGQELPLDTSLADEKYFCKTKLPKRLEQSWCNMLAAHCKKFYPTKQVSFLHIPPRLAADHVAYVLTKKLKDLSFVERQNTRP